MRRRGKKFIYAADHSAEYRVWSAIKQRCQNPNHPQWKDYGGRGIELCARWQNFDNFFTDMGTRPSSKHTIDRFPDNDGDYEPTNCRWATRKSNSRNRRNNRKLTYDGRTMPITAWAEETGIPRETISSRLRSDWPVEEALTTPPTPQKSYRRRTKRMRLIKIGRRTKHIAAWARESGIPESAIRFRLRKGWSPQDAISKPIRVGR